MVTVVHWTSVRLFLLCIERSLRQSENVVDVLGKGSDFTCTGKGRVSRDTLKKACDTG